MEELRNDREKRTIDLVRANKPDYFIYLLDFLVYCPRTYFCRRRELDVMVQALCRVAIAKVLGYGRG